MIRKNRWFKRVANSKNWKNSKLKIYLRNFLLRNKRRLSVRDLERTRGKPKRKLKN